MIKSDSFLPLRRAVGALGVLILIQAGTGEFAQAFPGDSLLPKGLRFSRDKNRSQDGSNAASPNAAAQAPSVATEDVAKDVTPEAVQSLQPYASDIPNLKYVSGRLLRGGQPTEQGLAFLKDAGVKTIINLRTEPVLIERERAAAKRLGLNFIAMPTYTVQEPDAKQFHDFLSAVDNPANGPTYVHCFHGRDRTGTMIGAYRIAENGWTFDAAFQEMMACGFRPGFAPLTNGLHKFAQARGDKSPLPSGSFIMSDLAKRLHR